MSARRAIFALAVAGALACVAVLASAKTRHGDAPAAAELASLQQPAGLWSAPASLSRCAAEGPARVVFPSNSPAHATGPGAIVWDGSAGCPGGAGARVTTVGAGEQPGASVIARTPAGRALTAGGPLQASGAPHGQVLIGAPSAPGAAGAAGGAALLIQGAAGGPFSTLTPAAGAGAPLALATAYLGDVALAAPPAGQLRHGGQLRVQVERFFATHFGRSVAIDDVRAGPVQTLVATLDYRSEVLVAWTQGGAIYACLVPADGAPRPVQRLASAGSNTHLSALLSDDRRGMVAWSEKRDGATDIYIDRSAVGVRFGEPELLEHFSAPDGLPAPAASPTLVRLSSESVMLAWAGASSGRWVVRVAPVDLNGLGEVGTIAAAGADALVADLAVGPLDDALVLWTEPSPGASGAPDMARQALYAAHGFNLYPPARAVFGEAELVAPPGPVSSPTVAFDPDTDDALAVWQGEAGAIEYSIRK